MTCTCKSYNLDGQAPDGERVNGVPCEACRGRLARITPPDGYEAVWLPTDVVDEWVGLPTTDYPPSLAQARATIYACREAQARRSPATEPPPADDSEPPEVKRRTRREVTADFTEGTRTIREWANGGGVHGPALCEELDAWLDYWGGSPPTPAPSPVPPWPGAVLSGLCDEDGVSTWLAQAGDVRGGKVRGCHGVGWGFDTVYSDSAWVEVRAPRAVPVPETERVPWWEALRDGRRLAACDEGEWFPCEASGIHDDTGERWVGVSNGGVWTTPAPDGTVEVLKDGDR